MIRIDQTDNLFSLTRLGIGHDAPLLSDPIDWHSIYSLAVQQGLLAIVADGMWQLSEAVLPPKDLRLRWIGQVMQGFEYRYEKYRRALSELAGFYHAHGFKMMVLKGYACGLNWPKREHRPYGDIDIWLFGANKQADMKMAQEKGIIIDATHHHHTVFSWCGFVVENHFDFINVYHHKSNVEIEKVFKELGKDDTRYVEEFGVKIYLPSPNLHALFLLKHAMNDFSSTSMSLRQVLDWAFHVQRYGHEIDWDWLLGELKKNHMEVFFNTINAICVEEFGFAAGLFPSVRFDLGVKEMVLQDILSPKNPSQEPIRVLPRLLFKYKRWKSNEWKHKLCYNESMWSAFWSGVWSHILKPRTI